MEAPYFLSKYDPDPLRFYLTATAPETRDPSSPRGQGLDDEDQVLPVATRTSSSKELTRDHRWAPGTWAPSLTRNSAIGFLNALTVAPITAIVRDIPSEVLLTPEDGLLTDCAANMDNIQTVPKHNLDSLIAYLSSEMMEEVNQAIAFALGLDVPTFGL